MYTDTLLYQWLINRIRSIAGVVGLFSSMCVLFMTVLAIAILSVVSLIPLYLSANTEEVLGELYCINNYSLTVGFQIPQYNTTSTVTMASPTYNVTSTNLTVSPLITNCRGPIGIQTSETVVIKDTCAFQLLSIIYPAVPNAEVFDNYALSEACYRTLQTCSYDSLLTSCILSNCVVVSSVDPSTNGSYSLTNYTLRCAANIYYRTRCVDSPASYGLNYSSSQRNSACRQQRLDRINTCLNSTVQLLNVPCLISVSSGIVTSTSVTCKQAVTTSNLLVTISRTAASVTTSTTSTFTVSINPTPNSLPASFTTQLFSSSDQSSGHVYRISSVNSGYYPSSQAGALYCGAVTQTQIASSITTAISSQTSG